MKRIGLLSDTHSYIDENILAYFDQCDEIWHAGDIGNIEVLERLEACKNTRAVFGNIDGAEIRRALPKDLLFNLEGLNVFMTHIGGYPGRYNKRIEAILKDKKPDLYICGHSHILKIVRDQKLKLLHINPGACGHHGFHKVRTLIRFELNEAQISNLQVIELGVRGRNMR